MTRHPVLVASVLAIAGAAFALAACTSQRAYVVPPPTNTAYTDAERTELANTIRDAFKENCWGCHGEPGKEAFGDFDYVLDHEKLVRSDVIDLAKPEKSEIYDLVASGNMPRKMNEAGKPKLKNPLPPAVADKLLEWIRAGAPKWE